MPASSLPQRLEAALGDLQARWRQSWPAGVPTVPHYPHGEDLPLSEVLRRWAKCQPDKAAVIFYGHLMSYAELDRLSDRFASVLAERGVERGDRVSVLLPNCPQFHIVFFGILKLGAVYAPVSPMSTAFELSHHLQDAGSTALVTLDTLMPQVRRAREGAPLRAVFTTSAGEMLPAEPCLPLPDLLREPPLPCDDAEDLLRALVAARAPAPSLVPEIDDMAALNYTGGSTGLPKGCIHTQRDMVYTAACGNQVATHCTADSVVLSFFPEFWIAGENNGLIFPVFAGATLVLLTRWDALTFMTAVQRWRVSIVSMAVDCAIEVMEHPRVEEFDLRSLTTVRGASFVKKLDVDVRRRWRALTGSSILSAPYGMTETHTVDTFTRGLEAGDHDLLSAPLFVGLPMPGTDLLVCDFDSGEPLTIGVEGEICMRTPSLMKGYWKNPEEFARVHRDGWFHTGDIGSFDEQGCLHYLGRRKEMLKVKGMSVFPTEIEAVLARHPAVHTSAVIPAPDDVSGQVPVAFVVLRPEAAMLSAEALREWCGELLAPYKVPRVRLMDSLPMTATGKIRKQALAELLDARAL